MVKQKIFVRIWGTTCSYPGWGVAGRALWGGMPTTPPSLWQGKLRSMDVQLLGQLCSLGLEIRELQEELVAFLEEEEENIEEEEEEDLEGKQEEGHLGTYCPASGHRLPDFEMTI